MKFLTWKIQLALALIGASAGLYALNYLIFRDTNYMLRLFLAQLGFLPISVLLVTIILNQLLGQRAKAAKLAKLNMVIGAFFSEVGGTLLKTLSAYDRSLPDFQPRVAHISHWTAPDFAGFSQGLAENDFRIRTQRRRSGSLTRFPAEKAGLSPAPPGKPQPAGTRLLFQPAAGGLPPDRGTGPAHRPLPPDQSPIRSTWRATCSGATSCSSKSGWPTWRILRPATPISSPWPCAPTPSTPSPPRRSSERRFSVFGGEARTHTDSQMNANSPVWGWSPCVRPALKGAHAGAPLR